MGKKSSKVFIVACIALALSVMAGPAFAAETAISEGTVSSSQLIENPDRYNEKQVVYEGEVVGDILQRGEFAWVTVNDDHYSRMPVREYDELKGGNSGIGVYGPISDLEDIHFLGSYDTYGDLVEVRGTFYTASSEHGGDTCIVADEIRIVQRGRGITRSLMRTEFILACVLLVICAALASLVLIKRKKRFSD